MEGLYQHLSNERSDTGQMVEMIRRMSLGSTTAAHVQLARASVIRGTLQALVEDRRELL